MRKSSEKWKMRMSAENWEMRMSSEKWKLRMSNLPRLVVTLLILPLATPSLYSSKDQVGDCIQFCYCYFYVYFYLYVYFYFASSEKIQFWYFYFHPTDSRWWSSMQTTSTQHWRGGSMPGWSSSMQAGRKSFWAEQITLRQLFKSSYWIHGQIALRAVPNSHNNSVLWGVATVRTCHPLSRSWRAKWQTGEMSSRCFRHFNLIGCSSSFCTWTVQAAN